MDGRLLVASPRSESRVRPLSHSASGRATEPNRPRHVYLVACLYATRCGVTGRQRCGVAIPSKQAG
jgi:hypothetical protein